MSPVNICRPLLLPLKENDGCLQINNSAQRTCVGAFGTFHLFSSFHLPFPFIASDLVFFSPHLQMVSCPARLCFLPMGLL